jgi:hypothetical protein
MLHTLLPAAALLTQTSAAKSEVKIDNATNGPVAQEKDVLQPSTAASPWIADGGTQP